MKNSTLFSLIGILCLAACNSSSVDGWQTSDLQLLPLEADGEAFVYVDTATGQETDWGTYESATLFYDGFALTTQMEEGYRFVNKRGEPLGETSYCDATIFHDGIAWTVRPGSPLTAIDKNGKTLFEFKPAETACAFHDGAAAFCNAEGLWGLVDTKGNVLVEPCWADVVPMVVDGLIAAKDPDYGWCLADKTGKTISDFFLQVGTKNYEEGFQQNYVQALAEGRIPFKDQSGKWGIIDRTGRAVIKAQFDELQLDGDNYLFRKGRMWGWCDAKGHYLINPQFREALPFADRDLAAAKNSDGDWGFIDRKGNWVIQPQFGQAREFLSSGIALAEDDNSGDYGAIDKTGKWVVNPQFKKMYDYGAGNRILVQDQSGSFGIIDSKGEYILAPNYPDALLELLKNVSGLGAKYKAQSDYIDVDIYADLIDKQIHALKSATLQELMNIYGIKQTKFPKGGGEVVFSKKKATSDMNFKITAAGIDAWSKASDGWFGYNYTFRPDVRVDSYTFVVEFDGRGRAWRFIDQIADALKKKYPYDDANGTLTVEGYRLVFMAAIPNGGIIFHVKPE